MSQRRCPIIGLNLEQIKKLVRPALSANVVDFELMTQGAINTNYRVALDSGKSVLLRLYGQKNQVQACRIEVDVINLVAATVPVAEVLHMGTTDDGREYVILKWCEGILLQQLLDGGKYLKSKAYLSDVMAAVGETLAAIGFYEFAQAGFFTANLKIEQPFTGDATDYIRSCLTNDLVKERLGVNLHKRLSNHIDLAANDLNQYMAGAKTVLVHGDFNPLNILVTENRGRWGVSAVLDWEFAHAGTALFDIGNFLRNEQKYPGMTEAFIEGYKKSQSNSDAQLPPDWRQIARLVDLNSLLEFLTVAETRQELFQKTIATLEHTLAN